MVAIRVLDSVSYPLQAVIRQRLAAAKSVSMAVAFLRESGLKAIGESFLRFLDKGGALEGIFGFDHAFTEAAALTQMAEWAEAHSRCQFFVYASSTVDEGANYHPKLYIIREPEVTHVVVGSSNLTRGGLRDNVEANVLISGAAEKEPVVEAEALYSYVRNRDCVFVPDSDYRATYARLYGICRAGYKKVLNQEELAPLRAELARGETMLPGTVPTQKDLVVEAIRTLTTGRGGGD
jgi:HKD family nuclease